MPKGCLLTKARGLYRRDVQQVRGMLECHPWQVLLHHLFQRTWGGLCTLVLVRQHDLGTAFSASLETGTSEADRLGAVCLASL